MDIKTACRDISELKPIAQIACNEFLASCKKNNLDIFITETYRPQERQNYLYSQGRTQKGNIVTWTLKSNHTGRMAWDIACSPPNNLYDVNILRKAGEIAKNLKITWGGTWKSPDMPHFEINDDWNLPKTSKEENEECDEMIYNYIDENMPEWAVPTIKKIVQKGYLKGNDKGELGLTDYMLKMLVINDRAGLYD